MSLLFFFFGLLIPAADDVTVAATSPCDFLCRCPVGWLIRPSVNFNVYNRLVKKFANKVFVSLHRVLLTNSNVPHSRYHHVL